MRLLLALLASLIFFALPAAAQIPLFDCKQLKVPATCQDLNNLIIQINAIPPGSTSFAAPTGTIGTSANPGVLATAMRSDATPQIPQCSSTTFGACKADGSTIVASGGVLTSTGGTNFGPPTATITTSAQPGVNNTAMRSDAAPAIAACTNAVLGACRADGTTITAAAGVLSAVSGGGNMVGSAATTLGNVLQSNNTGATLTTATDTGIAATDLARLSGTQTFSGAKTFASGLKATGLAAGTVATNSFIGLDAGNNFVLSAAGGGAGTVTSVTLGPGFTTTAGTCNTGSQVITTTGTINGQECIATHATSYTLGSSAGDSGMLHIATGAAVTFTAPNPAAATKGNVWHLGSDGTNGYTITTAGGTATFYGCAAGGGGTSLSATVNSDVFLWDDGASYKCMQAPSPNVPIALTWYKGQDLSQNAVPIANIAAPRTLVSITCNVEVPAGTAQTLQPVKAASGTALSAGTNLTSATCNANGTAATDQALTPLTVTALLAGDRIGLKAASASATAGTGVITFVVR